MDQMWPWIALGIALLTLLYDARPLAPPSAESQPDVSPRPPLRQELAALAPAYLLWVLGVVTVIVFGSKWKEPAPGLMDAGIGMAIGLLMASAAHSIERSRPSGGSSKLTPLALALAAAALAEFPETVHKATLEIGVVLGAAGTTGLFAVIDRHGWLRMGQLALLFKTALLALAVLGAARTTPEAASTTLLLGVAFLFAMAAGQAIGDVSRREGGMPAVSRGVVALISAALFLMVTLLINSRYLEFDLATAMTLLGGGLLTAGLCAWILPEDAEPSEGAAGLACLLWVGSATVAFGILQGYGMALWGLSALLVVLAADAKRAALSLGVLGGLLLYRILLEQTGMRGLDLAQHYGTTGLLAGAILPLAIRGFDAGLQKVNGPRGPILALLAAVIADVAVLLFLAIAGPKGAAGFVVGLALAPAIALIRGDKNPFVLTAVTALGALAILGFDLLQPLIELDRTEKVRWLVYASAIGFVLVSVLGLLGRPGRGAGMTAEGHGDGNQ